MSFTVGKKASISVQSIKLKVKGMKDLPLASVSISMGIDTPCTCTCVPITGRDRLKGKKSDPDFLEKLDPSMKCEVSLDILSKGDIGSNKKEIFVGRPMASEMLMSTNPFGSRLNTTVMLQHIAQSDLSGVAIGQRSYYRVLPYAKVKQFRLDPNGHSALAQEKFTNKHLLENKIAVYLKDLCISLADWYMNNSKTKGIDVVSLLKAIPCVIRPEIVSVMTPGTNYAKYSASGSFTRAVIMTVNGAAASKATLLSVLSTLSSFAMLTLIPTTNAYVISPKLDISRWTKETGVHIPRSVMTEVDCPTAMQRFPVEVVGLNKRFGSKFYKQEGGSQIVSGVMDWGDTFIYPKLPTTTGVLLVDPPPILANLINCSSSRAAVTLPPVRINDGGTGLLRNSVGATPLTPDKNAPALLGSVSARLMWSKLAYAHRTARIHVLPHWVFSKDFDNELHASYETGVPWSLIGKDVRFRMPYDPDGVGDADVMYVGYVKGMTLQASVEGPSLDVTLSLTNVRTEAEDKNFALPSQSNPLYVNVNGKPV